MIAAPIDVFIVCPVDWGASLLLRGVSVDAHVAFPTLKDIFITPSHTHLIYVLQITLMRPMKGWILMI